MPFEDVDIKYDGVQPSDFTKTYIQSAIQQIYDQAPDGSSILASFSENQDLMRGTLQISSLSGRFFAEATDVTLAEVTRALTEDIEQQLKEWKANRFIGEAHESSHQA